MRELLTAIWLEGFYRTWCRQRGFDLERKVFYRNVKQEIRQQERSRVYH